MKPYRNADQMLRGEPNRPRQKKSDKERIEWDGAEPGLGIRYRSGRTPCWHFQMRNDGATLRRSLGRIADVSREEARAAAKAMRAELNGEPIAPVTQKVMSVSFVEFTERFLKDGTPSWKPATLRSHRHAVRQWIVPVFGERDLGSISAKDVAAWWAEMDTCAGSKNRALAVLSGMMRHAELLGFRSPGSNPCQGLRRRKSEFKVHQLSDTDYQRLGEILQRHARDFPVETALIRFLALTGARNGEARLLRWDMIDGRRAALPDSKTGPRAIWLGAPALQTLDARPISPAFVFAKRGKPVSYGQLWKFWGLIRTELGLPRIRLHDLRHGFASVAISSGEPLRTVSELLGHTELQTTAGYARFTEASVHQAAARVAGHLTAALSGQKTRRSPA